MHDLQYLVDRVMEDANGTEGMRPVVEKELLHYDILFALQKGGFLDGLVFQGGTALRLCHGSPRFSEDLGFAGGADFTSAHLAPLAGYLTDFVSGRYGLVVEVRAPAALRDTPDNANVTVEKWRLSVVTQPANSAIPRQRIHLEIANVPSHANELRLLARNYDFMPDGYNDMMIRVETKEEILADKLVAFPARLPTYVRWRDVWDIHWLGRKGASVVTDLVRAKANDYGIEDFGGLLEAATARLPELVRSGDFAKEMERFLTDTVAERTIRTEGWLEAVAAELRERLAGLRRDLARRSNGVKTVAAKASRTDHPA